MNIRKNIFPNGDIMYMLKSKSLEGYACHTYVTFDEGIVWIARRQFSIMPKKINHKVLRVYKGQKLCENAMGFKITTFLAIKDMVMDYLSDNDLERRKLLKELNILNK